MHSVLIQGFNSSEEASAFASFLLSEMDGVRIMGQTSERNLYPNWVASSDDGECVVITVKT